MRVATIDFLKAFDSTYHNSIWDALQNLWYRTWIHQPLEKILQKPIKQLLWPTRRVKFFPRSKKKRGPSSVDPLSSLLFNTVLQVAFWQKKKGMGICLGDCDLDCRTNLRFADDVLLFATKQRSSFKNCCATSSIAQKWWDSKCIQEKRRFLAATARAEEEKWRDWQHQSGNINPKWKHLISWDRRLHSSNRRRPRSRIVSGLPGRRFTFTNKSTPRNRIFFGTGFACSTRWSPQRWTAPQEHGHSQKNMKEWFNRHSAKCSASSS